MERKIRLIGSAVVAMTLAVGLPAYGGSVVQNNTAVDLVNAILGPGITVVGTPTVTGAAGAFGGFSGFGGDIGLDTGIIIGSGNVVDAVGPNTADNTTTNHNTPGDATLSALAGVTTFDAAFLQFDFQFGDGSVGGDLFFSYVFASEEYNEFANSNVNDTFAMLLDGANIALIPSTSTPVSINTVNGGNPLGTNAQNSAFFNNNDPSDLGTPTPFDIEYDGFTDVFLASATGLSAGTHTIKMAIADGGDSILDSAVFIGGGTFSNDPDPDPNPVVPVPAAAFAAVPLLAGLALRRRQRRADA